MTAFTDKAAAVTAALQDYARDIEADLGKQNRATAENPNWGHVHPFTDPGPDLAEYQARKDRFPDDTPPPGRVSPARLGRRGTHHESRGPDDRERA